MFAPHYAAPVPHRLKREATLLEGRGADAAVMTTLSAGDAFELLDVTAGIAWGIAPAAGLVGYLPLAALEATA